MNKWINGIPSRQVFICPARPALNIYYECSKHIKRRGRSLCPSSLAIKLYTIIHFFELTITLWVKYFELCLSSLIQILLSEIMLNYVQCNLARMPSCLFLYLRRVIPGKTSALHLDFEIPAPSLILQLTFRVGWTYTLLACHTPMPFMNWMG